MGCCSSHLTDGETEAPRGGGLDLVSRPQSQRDGAGLKPQSVSLQRAARLQDGGHPYIHSIRPSKGSREQCLLIDGPFPRGNARPWKEGEQVSWAA